MKFVLENKSKITISGMTSDSEIDLIIQAWLYPDGDYSLLQVMCGVEWVDVQGTCDNLCQSKIYRVMLKPYATDDALRDLCKLPGNNLQCPEADIIRKLADSLGDKS